jgi:hypothetical protein
MDFVSPCENAQEQVIFRSALVSSNMLYIPKKIAPYWHILLVDQFAFEHNKKEMEE